MHSIHRLQIAILLLTQTFCAFVLFATSVFAADRYLAVGPGGQRMFSSDGLRWENHIAWGEPKHDQNDLNVAAFFRGTAYAGGGYFSGRIAATRDGVQWSEGVLPKSSPIFGLEVLGGTLYAVTLRGQVYASTEGSNFILVATANMPTKTHWIRSTATGNGIIVGSGDFGPAIAFDQRSSKISVTQMAGQSEKNATLKRVAFGNGIFVVGGQDGLLASSADGITWKNNETRPERGKIYSVVWTGDRFIASTEKTNPLQSTDGLTWTLLQDKLPKSMVHAGNLTFGWAWPPNKLERSFDAVEWEPVQNERAFYVKHLAYGTLAGSGEPPRLPSTE